MSEDYYCAFSYAPGIGSITFQKLITHFGSIKNAYEANRAELSSVIGIKLTDKFITFRKTFNIEKVRAGLKSQDITYVSQNNPLYPSQLLSIYDPPIGLFVKGNPNLLQIPHSQLFSIVGTRKATSYGLVVTETITKQLVEYGYTIVSGMALGIDSQAHWSALGAKGQTIAVLGGGVDVVYPESNDALYRALISKSGVIISEFPPGQLILKGLFVARNRIVSALSVGTLVVEGDEKSGALITAKCALEQGKDVFAVPGPITSSLSWAPNMLIKQGATAVTTTDDILQNYNVQIKKHDITSILEKVTGLDKKVVMLLIKEPLSTDELTVLLNIPVTEILYSLSMLELRGFIKRTSQGSFMMV